MMDVEYRREMNRNYMIIRPETVGNEKYTIRMLNGNQIQGLLSFQDKRLDGEVRYYYDITSKQPLSRVLEHRTISGRELRVLITELIYTLKQLERFLLDERQLCLQPEFIYIDPNSFKGAFCLLPGMYQEFSEELCNLSQYLLDHVNHGDGEAVVLAFSVFRECRKLNFGIEDIEKCLRQQDEIGNRTEMQQGDSSAKMTTKPKMTTNTTMKTTTDSRGVEENRRVSSIDKNEELKTEKQNTGSEDGIYQENRSGMIPIGIGLAMIAVPIIIGFLFGIGELYRRRWILLAVELLAFIGVCITARSCFPRENIKDNEKYTYMDDEEPWEVYFREEAEKEFDSNKDFECQKENFGRYAEEKEEDIHTTLLNARPLQKGGRKLVSVNGGQEISIGYFPFIIGKNRDITDYCLNRPEISRLHVKLEEAGEKYMITDLNSTNGTAVNGVLLEANETTVLMPGDEVMIANECFYFR